MALNPERLIMMGPSQELYIFYMKYSEKLHKDFFVFHNFFQEYGIKLVPIYPSQLPDLIKGSVPHILSVTNDLESKSVFDVFRKKFLDYALLNSRVSLYEVTSFPEILLTRKPGNETSYISLRLPQNFQDLSNQILYQYFSNKNISKKWPGGKRSTLPQS